MKTLVYTTVIVKKHNYSVSQPKLHSAWFSISEAKEKCIRLHIIHIDAFFVCENHNYNNGQIF